MKNLFLLVIFFLTKCLSGNAQIENIKWDNTIDENWPVGFIETQITSSADSSSQMAIFYKTSQSKPQPLIVSLHTWSGDYKQEDPLAKEVLLRDWNYIHPDFRGPNNTPKACGSDLVIKDIEDAIRFVILNGKVDQEQVHIIGVSGGGYATLLAYMKINYPVRSFNAWASISNIENWYWECKGRNLKYVDDIVHVTSNGNGFDPVDARKRSPIFMKYQIEKRKGSFINIYAGIHDGYNGSVPITHSINMYNKLVADIYPQQTKKLISDSVIISLLASRINSSPDTNLFIGDRKIHLFKELPDLTLSVFEGGHEMIVPQALALVAMDAGKAKKLNILTIGDSNGAFDYGWPQQLKKLLPYSTVINKSIAGNTIGFDNLGQTKLNTLKNIEQYLNQSYNQIDTTRSFDYIFIGLGTNDCKKNFEKRQQEVIENLSILIRKIRAYEKNHQKTCATICIISPPPIDEQKVDKEKYEGGDKRIKKINRKFKKITIKNKVEFLDIYTLLKKGFSQKTDDGVHLIEKAQFQIANEILNYINQNTQSK